MSLVGTILNCTVPKAFQAVLIKMLRLQKGEERKKPWHQAQGEVGHCS